MLACVYVCLFVLSCVFVCQCVCASRCVCMRAHVLECVSELVFYFIYL